MTYLLGLDLDHGGDGQHLLFLYQDCLSLGNQIVKALQALRRVDPVADGVLVLDDFMILRLVPIVDDMDPIRAARVARKRRCAGRPLTLSSVLEEGIRCLLDLLRQRGLLSLRM